MVQHISIYPRREIVIPQPIQERKNFRWRVQHISPSRRDFILSRQKRLEEITKLGFKNNKITFSKRDIVRAISFSTHYAFLMSGGDIFGFAFFHISDVPDLKKKVLYMNNICIANAAQGSGCSSDLLTEVINVYDINYLQAKTQNPHLIRLFQKFSVLTFPFTGFYFDASQAETLLDYSTTHIPQLQDTTTPLGKDGIYRNHYKCGALGTFPFTKSVSAIEAHLNKFSFDREAGDAVLITSKIRK